MQTQVEQGKGTAEHLMPLRDWFSYLSLSPYNENGIVVVYKT